MARLFKSCIQGDFGGDHKNFEAVVLEGRDLHHWWRDNGAPGHPWKRGQRIIENRAAFPGSIIQSDFGDGHHGNFEVLVPLFGEGGTVELWHLWHDNADVTLPWSFGQRVTEAGRRVAGPASLVQSNFTSEGHGNFEVVVPVLSEAGQVELRHYWHDNSNVTLPWSAGQRVNDPSHAILGGGCLIQSNFGEPHGNFEVAAWVRLPDGRPVLQHYWHDNADVGLPWRVGQVIVAGASGNGGLIQGSFGTTHGNFEVVVPVHGPGGRTYLQHVWHDNSDVDLPWQLGQVISEVAASDASASIIESDYRSGDHGNFEVLVDECPNSLVAYWHPNEDVTLPWIRHAVLIGEPPHREVRTTTRICQLTGEFDRTGWNGAGPPPFAFNRTETRSNVRGTDLGVSFEHQGRLYFLFGDTWRLREAPSGALDAIAVCTDTRVQGGLTLNFHAQPPIVSGISQGGFEVPLDGFSFQERMYVLFSTDHRQVGDAELMGRSVLAVSDDDGHVFSPLLSFSRNKFINVSVERATLDASQAEAVGWPQGTEVLCMWGSGRYRASPAYFAMVNLQALIRALPSPGGGPVELAPINGEHGPVRFFTGVDQAVSWSPHEPDAVPLFCAGDIGELSGRHNLVFNRYFLTYNSGNPRGITLRHAPQPWGPWSEGTTVFNPGWGSGPDQPVGLGYGAFMHIPWNVAQVDHVQDDAFLSGRRDDDWAGEYGPYQIPRFTTGVMQESCELYYTMSTWNPYQSMLMKTQIRASDLG